MSVDIIQWPTCTLSPKAISADQMPFTRSGGRSLSGLERVTRTDRGWWSVSYSDIIIEGRAQRQCWNAIRSALGGRSGLVAVPVWSYDTAPWVNGIRTGSTYVPHSDNTSFSDGSLYRQGSIAIRAASSVIIGATRMAFTVINGDTDLAGTRFSYQHAMYEIGPMQSDGTYLISPGIRARIPAGADLEFDLPTCLCRLAEDRMSHSLTIEGWDSHSIGFVEAADYWSDIATAESFQPTWHLSALDFSDPDNSQYLALLED